MGHTSTSGRNRKAPKSDPVHNPVPKSTAKPRGKPAHVPTPETRAAVAVAAATNVPLRLIAQQIAVSMETLMKYYRMEIDTALERVNAKVEQNLLKHTERHVSACLAWLYSRAPERWKDMRHIEANTKHTLGGSFAEMVIASMGVPAAPSPKLINGRSEG